MTGTVVNSFSYEPFGQILAEQEAVAQPFKYVGQHGVMAEPSGLYYMRARYYDPGVGRFISEDPIGFAGGDVNLMGYVGNEPINWTDPDGLMGKKSKDVWEIGGYIIEKAKGDTFHGGEHYHILKKENLVGRVALNGEVVTGSVGNKLLKKMRGKGLIRGLSWIGIGLTAHNVCKAKDAKGAEAFENFMEFISILPERQQRDALEMAFRTHPELFE